ncbi:hypothetical protein BDV93DRAFT_608132 [Ceratobasidium sp. AG-I]|nr:hypothetical protein BDV93DRAFT_608132 [Ceratobasidium sp. AG-I]
MPALTRALRRTKASANIESNWVDLDPVEWALASSTTQLPAPSGISGVDFCRMGTALSGAVHHGLSNANNILQEQVIQLDASSNPQAELFGSSVHDDESRPLKAFALASSIASAFAFAPDLGSSSHHNEASAPGHEVGPLPEEKKSSHGGLRWHIGCKPHFNLGAHRAYEGRAERLPAASKKGRGTASAHDSKAPPAGDQEDAGTPEPDHEIDEPSSPSSGHGLTVSPISPDFDSLFPDTLLDSSHLIEEIQNLRTLDTILEDEDDDDSSSSDGGPSSPLSMCSQYTECSFHTAKGISDWPASVRLQLIPSYPD